MFSACILSNRRYGGMQMHARNSGVIETAMLRARISCALKCLIKLRSISRPDAMLHASICARVGFTPPTLAKLLASGAGKTEHLFALIEYLSVKPHELLHIAEIYRDSDDLLRLVSALIQKDNFSVSPPEIGNSHAAQTAQSA